MMLSSSPPLKPFHHLQQVASKVTREKGREEKDRVGGFCDPSLEEAHIPSAHISLAGISHMPPGKCGLAECLRGRHGYLCIRADSATETQHGFPIQKEGVIGAWTGKNPLLKCTCPLHPHSGGRGRHVSWACVLLFL